ncbi:Ser Thr protein phosphatase family protein [Musa troglodytarum]|uniref:Ser Thr protein phosphatase family protein n=1 Tax=Musa troglodytarum TaxID=320322 RepID=A0A9E7KV90_9LILI|nr:Ser Thr protein phosphatase family protein [Musa troglodytarum]URE35411.1 Ser Thr protein phosphatase family protein [Musa troglodytarum]
MASPISSAIFFFFSFSFAFVLSWSTSIEMENKVVGGEGAEPVARESFPIDGDVAWVVQVSDLHLSTYHPDRADDLVHLLAPALRAIRPSLLVITGDITDAKNKRRTTTRQDISEWIQYSNSMEAIVKYSGIDKRRIFDIRGNHDKYGVPYVGHELDFFSTYSVSSQLGRLSTVQSISLVGDDRKYLFIGIDDTLSIGIRGPSNLFGHPTEKRMAVVESELQYWDIYPSESVTKYYLGTFQCLLQLHLKKDSVMKVYLQGNQFHICGHLHGNFSRQLWRLHPSKLSSDVLVPRKAKGFWEWELGDWKESRLIRILSIDGGVVSFHDIELPRKHDVQDEFQTTIVITYPADSRNMNNMEQNNQSFRNDINALVFSTQQIINVTAKVFDSFRDYKIVEEVPLQLISAVDKPLFHGKWNAESYRSASATRYLLQVSVMDYQGKETKSNLRPFSVEGKLAHDASTWLAYLVFQVEWQSLYMVLLWSNFSFLVVFLCLPKVLNYLMERNASYQKWATPHVISLPIKWRQSLFVLFWFLMEGSRNRILWFSMVMYLLCLLNLPWFWGYATSENENIAAMYLSGWRVQSLDSHAILDKLGNPDMMETEAPEWASGF